MSNSTSKWDFVFQNNPKDQDPSYKTTDLVHWDYFWMLITEKKITVNHWAKFNQTCCRTSPHGKDVQEQHYFFRSSILRPHDLLLNHWEEFSQICYMSSQDGMGARQQHYFPVCQFVCPSITLSSLKALRLCECNIIFHFSLLSGKSVRICISVPWTAPHLFLFIVIFRENKVWNFMWVVCLFSLQYFKHVVCYNFANRFKG